MAPGTLLTHCGDRNGKEVQKRGDMCRRVISQVALVVKEPPSVQELQKAGV